MKGNFSIGEVVALVPFESGTAELCADADASFDNASKNVVVTLNCYLSPVDITAPNRRVPASWLPCGETVRVPAEPEEAAEIARDVFNSWVKRVRHAAPELASTVA